MAVNHLLSVLTGLGLALPALAGAATLTTDAVRASIEERLQSMGVEAEIDRISETPVENVFMVRLGTDIVFFSADGRYLLQGEMIDLQRRESVSEVWFRDERAERLGGLNPAFFLTYPAHGETDHVVTVFTDIDCPYCQRMHDQMPGYNAAGIEVRYVQFPRAGIDSPSYQKAVDVWCADDPLLAMGAAKAGRAVESPICDHPIDQHFALARELGINATPTFISQRGVLHRGLMSPEELRSRLDAEQR